MTSWDLLGPQLPCKILVKNFVKSYKKSRNPKKSCEILGRPRQPSLAASSLLSAPSAPCPGGTARPGASLRRTGGPEIAGRWIS